MDAYQVFFNIDFLVNHYLLFLILLVIKSDAFCSNPFSMENLSDAVCLEFHVFESNLD